MNRPMEAHGVKVTRVAAGQEAQSESGSRHSPRQRGDKGRSSPAPEDAAKLHWISDSETIR